MPAALALVFFDILAFPSETFAHRHQFQSQPLCGSQLAGLPFAFDELNDRNSQALAKRSESNTKGGGRFAFAVSGIDQQESAGVGHALDHSTSNAGRCWILEISVPASMVDTRFMVRAVKP